MISGLRVGETQVFGPLVRPAPGYVAYMSIERALLWHILCLLDPNCSACEHRKLIRSAPDRQYDENIPQEWGSSV